MEWVDMPPAVMAQVDEAMTALVASRVVVTRDETETAEVYSVVYDSPNGSRVYLGSTWPYEEGWAAVAGGDEDPYGGGEELGAYPDRDQAIARIVWYAPHARGHHDRVVAVGPWRIWTILHVEDVRDAARRAFPNRDLPVSELFYHGDQDAYLPFPVGGRRS